MRNSKASKSKKTKSTALFCLLLIVIAVLAYSGFHGFKNIAGYRIKPFSETINKGLDLQGGISVLEEVQSKNFDNSTIETTIEMLSMRVNPNGAKETTVAREGKNRIRIEIPGEYDSKKVLESIGKTGKLEFKGPDNKVILTGKDVKTATSYMDEMGKPTIGLELNAEGTKKFAEATSKFLNQPIGIYMDGEELTKPVVQSVITNGKATITGSKSLEEAKRQSNIIKSGALPVTLKAAELKTVGATLGQNALPLSMKAGAIGIGLILLFMLFYYRAPGLMADIALVFYVFIVLATFSAANVTLTLSGIAGFLLTVGMAVDANVLIFERIKEELKIGKSIRTAVEAGFNRALSSILDSNITTIIAGVVLYSLGSGSVKGFALTLMIGIILSIFTALTVTKLLLKLGIEMGLINSTSHFGVKKKETSNRVLSIIEKTKIWFSLSLIVIIIGITLLGVKGLNYGIDFKGGTLATIEMGKGFNQDIKEEVDKIVRKYDSNATTNIANETQLDIKSNTLTNETINKMFNDVKQKYKLKDNALVSQSNVGPAVGEELKDKALKAFAIATIAMLIYIAMRFEIKFGIAAITALLHDILITVSIYAIFRVPVNSPFIAAILTILGYSINDTIVIFDRIRENNKKMRGKNLEELANVSITQTMTRSINTVLTTLFTIVAVYIFVPSVRDFAFPLIIGIVSGAYSSIFIASPIWVMLKKRKSKNKAAA